MLQEKQFYLSCLEKGAMSQRSISNRLSARFSTSPASVKDALLAEGLIELSHTKREGTTQKINHYYQLTDKKLKPPVPKQPKIVADKWDDGTPKSKGNAFDWTSPAKSMFDNREIARMTQKYHQNKPITIYSRA
jgi:DNA-binding transcriptional ArsR family regulator